MFFKYKFCINEHIFLHTYIILIRGICPKTVCSILAQVVHSALPQLANLAISVSCSAANTTGPLNATDPNNTSRNARRLTQSCLGASVAVVTMTLQVHMPCHCNILVVTPTIIVLSGKGGY